MNTNNPIHIALRALALFSSLALASCASQEQKPDRYQPEPYVKLTHPDWAKNATIYQLNTRQFSEEGTFAAAQTQLPRLKQLGVDIIWLMPIHPIGEKNRKETLGSPYSVKDYFGVNKEFGDLDDLKRFVNHAHDLGMYVILDWVANHTAWDNPMQAEHPEWYEKDYSGNFRPTPWWDWSDIIDLNYDAPGLREYMTRALKYWVEEADIDGYRADVAGFVPLDFWENARKELDEIKPVFMLAEWEMRDLHAEAFDMSYAWSWEKAMHQVATGHGLDALFVYYSWNESAYPKDSYRMTYVSNHDVNAWEGSAVERYGDALHPAIVLSVIGEGMPLIYNGQEAGNAKRLAFFEKDNIEWKEHPTGSLYKKLFELQHENTALWHGKWGATMVRVWNSAPQKIFSFVRENPSDKVFTVINFSDEPQTVTFFETLHHGQYVEYISEEISELSENTKINLPPWGYKVFVKK